MAVKMRLMRMGKTKSPHYRVVVMDGRAPRDGRYIDLIGRYDPREDPSVIEIDADKAVDWLRKGAQPTEAVQKLLEVSGALTQFKVKSGRIHTVGGDSPDTAPAPAPAAADEAAATDEPATEEAPPAEEVTAQAVEPVEEPVRAGGEAETAEVDEEPVADDEADAGDAETSDEEE
jgi:small subunit ribosomal protein S16